MVEAKQIDDWNHTASMIAWTVRMAVGKKANRVQPKHFHPITGTRKRASERKTKMPKQEAYRRLNAMVGMQNGN